MFGNDDMTIDYDVIAGEDRWTVIGETDQLRILIVVFTMRGTLLRTVTAFEAGVRLRKEYFKAKGQ